MKYYVVRLGGLVTLNHQVETPDGIEENYKKYIVIEGKLPVLNEKAIQEESRKDGFFAVITNVKNMTSSEIVLQYKSLNRIHKILFHFMENEQTGN